MLRRGLIVCLLAFACAPATAADDYDKALAFYESQIDRPPLTFRLSGMRKLAETKDPRALAVLGKRYAKPRVPKNHERYLLAAVIGQHFTGAQHVEALWKLVKKHKKDEHGWLWANALRGPARQHDQKDVCAAALDGKLKPFLRAAALDALATEKHPDGLALVTELTGDPLPRGKQDRILVLEAAAAMLHAWRDEMHTPAWKTAAGGVIDLLANKDVADRTKLVVARHLAKIFHVDRVTLEHQYWRRLLAVESAETGDGETVEGRPRFFGLEATGSRIAYVLDMSDSMLDRVTPRELDDAKALHGDKSPKEGGVDWTRIQSRFDLARAFLKQSIEALPKGVSYVVIAFGDEAALLRSTKGLVKASRGNIKATIKELDAIEPGRPAPNRPHGTLRGTTNLHGALLRAFRANPKGLTDELEHVDASLLTKGCDTVFVFSDGKPTKDDFDATDRFDGGKITLDREKGQTGTQAAGSANYFGPYLRTGNLLTDLRRLNLFRKAEIHTIAMGEADSRLLRQMAEQGLGGYRPIGILGREGKINAWWVIGTFPAPKIDMWDKEEEPEKGVVLRQALTIGEKRVRWKRVFTAHPDAVVGLGREFADRSGKAAYAYAEIDAKVGGPAKLVLGSDDGVRVWLNGKLVHSKLEKRKLIAADDAVEVDLVKGPNRILVKVMNVNGSWQFCMKVTDRNGRPYAFLMK